MNCLGLKDGVMFDDCALDNVRNVQLCKVDQKLTRSASTRGLAQAFYELAMLSSLTNPFCPVLATKAICFDSVQVANVGLQFSKCAAIGS